MKGQSYHISMCNASVKSRPSSGDKCSISTRSFCSSSALKFSFPFTNNGHKNDSTESSFLQSSPFRGKSLSLSPSPFEKKNVLCSSLGIRNRSSPEESVSSVVFESKTSTHDFRINGSDFAQELLRESSEKHMDEYTSVVVAKIPACKVFFEKMKSSQEDQIEDLHKEVQKFITDFSKPPSAHPHSKSFVPGVSSGEKYYKTSDKPSDASTMASYFNNVSKSFVLSGSANGIPCDAPKSATFSPFEKPNFNPDSHERASRARAVDNSDPKSPFQVPNSSIPEYYKNYMTSSTLHEPSKQSSATIGAERPIASPEHSKKAENVAVDPMNPILQKGVRHQGILNFPSALSQDNTRGRSVRNLAATSLASTYSGSVESISESEGGREVPDTVFVSNNVKFDPHTSGTVVKCNERIADVDEAAMGDPLFGQNVTAHRSLHRSHSFQLKMRDMRLLGDKTEQDKLKNLVLTEDDAHQKAHQSSKEGYAYERPICKDCGKVFRNNAALAKHIQFSHEKRKWDVFAALRANFGSTRQLELSNPEALSHNDILDWCTPYAQQENDFCTANVAHSLCTSHPEVFAGYVAQKQMELSQKTGDGSSSERRAPRVKEEIGAASDAVNHIRVGGLLRFVGEKMSGDTRYLELSATVESPQARGEYGMEEHIPVRYFLSSARKPIQKKSRKESLIASKRKVRECAFAFLGKHTLHGVLLEDIPFLSLLSDGLQRSAQCFITGHLKQAPHIDSEARDLVSYAYIRVCPLHGSITFL